MKCQKKHLRKTASNNEKYFSWNPCNFLKATHLNKFVACAGAQNRSLPLEDSKNGFHWNCILRAAQNGTTFSVGIDARHCHGLDAMAREACPGRPGMFCMFCICVYLFGCLLYWLLFCFV